MTPPAPKYSDIPPNIAKAMSQVQRSIVKLYAIIGVLATGLVALAVQCAQHFGV